MVQALPSHIIDEIERRWQRRIDALPQAKPGNATDRSEPLCPQCFAPASIGAPCLGNPGRELVCDLCGHIWRNEPK